MTALRGKAAYRGGSQDFNFRVRSLDTLGANIKTEDGVEAVGFDIGAVIGAAVDKVAEG